MADNIDKTQSVSGETVEDMTQDYLTAIKELKENSVDRSAYDSLRAENKRLLDSLVNGQTIEKPSESIELPTRLDCYKKYKENNFNSDLDYWKNIVELREATIREYGKDPCVSGNFGVTPDGETIPPSYGEKEEIEGMFETIKEAINESDGNPAVFRQIMTQFYKN